MYKILLPYLVCTLFLPIMVRSQGIFFNSSSSAIEDRTSYSVFSHRQPHFGSKFNIEFDLSINDPVSFGYIVSVKDKKGPISYSITYIEENGSELPQLKLNLEGKKNLLTIPIQRHLLGNRKWIKVALHFDWDTKAISFSVNEDTHFSNEYKFEKNIEPEIYFGKHENIIDVAQMSIKNLIIYDEKKQYSFELNENSGEDVHDSMGVRYGSVKNPNWLINESFHWKLRQKFSASDVSAITFDENNQRFIITGSDSLIFYNFRNESTAVKKYANRLPVPMRLATSFMEAATGKLYIYEVNDVPNDNATIAALDLESFHWETISTNKLPQQRHHHNFLADLENGNFLIFGGFGNKRLTNSFDMYNIRADQWSSVSFSGDEISPRFFSGLVKTANQEFLIFGGVGNTSGDQSIGKTYFYDCYRINLEHKTIKKLWDISRGHVKMVSSRNMVLSNDSTSFYTLSYSEYLHQAFIYLYRYSIESGESELLADSIPIISEEILTNTNIYLNKATDELFCVIQEFDSDGANQIKIYSLNNPPVSQGILDKYNSKRQSASLFYWLVVPGIFLFLITYLAIKKRLAIKRRAIEQQVQSVKKYSYTKPKNSNKTNTVFLFGEFTVRDKSGKDISYFFSPKIRSLFILILLNSIKKDSEGISSEKLHAALWPDKPSLKAKNLRNVTINQLRKIIEDIQSLEIKYINGKYLLEIENDFYCDYSNFLYNLEKLKENPNNHDSLIQLIESNSSGQFLKSLDDECLDPYKKDFESEVFSIIPLQIKRLYKEQNFSLVIPLTEMLFNVDPLNEIAFYYQIHSYLKLKMEDKAQILYNNYVLKYKKILDEEYSYTFNETVKDIPFEESIYK